MFSKEVHIEAVTMYLQGIPPYTIRENLVLRDRLPFLTGLVISKNLVFMGLKTLVERRQIINIPLKSR